jgi:predicted  nucleic acid-binding Zn-ribbon protein
MRLIKRENFAQVQYNQIMASKAKKDPVAKPKKVKAPKKKLTNGDILVELKKEKIDVEKELSELQGELTILKGVSTPIPVTLEWLNDELEGANQDLAELVDKIKELEALPAEADA